MSSLYLALDTATDVTTVGLAWRHEHTIEVFATAEVDAPRAAMSRLLPMAESLLAGNGLKVRDLGGVVVGRGPGSFTGVRIGVATAKGLAQGLGVPLYGVGTLDAIAWGLSDEEALLGVVGDAMRGEVYPALFRLADGWAERLTPHRVAKPEEVVCEWAAMGEPLLLAGNGLRKYGAQFREALGESATVADEASWAPSGYGLFGAFSAALTEGDEGPHEPGEVLPVYTRLSDAEEAEAVRAGRAAAEAPANGVAGEAGEVRS